VPQSAQLMGLEIFAVNATFLIIDLRQRVSTGLSAARLVSLAIRLLYISAAVSLIFGIGGGFYLLAIAVIVTLGRTMANAWALLTALG